MGRLAFVTRATRRAVHVRTAHHLYRVVRRDSFRKRRIQAAARAHRIKLDDVLRHGNQLQHATERLASEVAVKRGDDNRLSHVRPLLRVLDDVVEELPLVDSYDLVRINDVVHVSEPRRWLRGKSHRVVRHDSGLRPFISQVFSVLDDEGGPVCDDVSPNSPRHLRAFAGEHGTENKLNASRATRSVATEGKVFTHGSPSRDPGRSHERAKDEDEHRRRANKLK
mmetsp:Transcript_71/g.144  ORF Transcript_71/g.144 Transcript_71/m.144 type:complete len:224 (-) Transcript_71:77-748(-)